MSSKTLFFLTLAFLAVMSGCHSAGPAAVTLGRGQINNALQQTDNEQMLANLVRLRYRDVACFLSLTSVTSSVEWGIDGSASAKVMHPRLDSKPNEFGMGVGGNYREKPTITYVPLTGEKFVNQLMTPVNTRVITLLYHSGWSISRICRLLLQNINGLPNAPCATGPTPDDPPEFKDFAEVMQILREMQKRRQVLLMLNVVGDQASLQLLLKPEVRESTAAKRLYELLKITPSKEIYTLQPGVVWQSSEKIVIYPRSLTATMYYLSQGVSVPASHYRKGLVTVTRNPDGTEFDWQELLGNLMQIKHSKLPPQNAYVKVYHRGYWFYIDDRDLDSKSTFCLLMQLFSLQAGGDKSMAPLLTIPV